MLIKNGFVYNKNYQFVKSDLFIKEELISDNFSNKQVSDIIDAEGLYVVPGLIDIHFHGCMNMDFSDANLDGIKTIAKYQLSNGITCMSPATMTLAEEDLINIAKTAANYKNDSGAILSGINLEGPFISHEKKGAQDSKHIIKPSISLYKRLQKQAKGLIKLVSIAPELKGAMDFISSLKDEVRLSIAHTSANYIQAKKAFKEGASQVTHLYNAMLPFSHREPGVIGAALDAKDIFVELIADGIHIHPSVIRASFKMFGDDKIILISDSMRATGMEDGIYSLGGQVVEKKGRLAFLSDKTLAGSVTNLMDCVRIAVKDMEIPLESVIRCATANPAKSINIYDKYGSLEVGKMANIILLDKELNIVKIIFKGKVKDEI